MRSPLPLFAFALILAHSPSLEASELKNVWFEKLGATTSLRSAYWSDDKSLNDDRHFAVASSWLTLRPEEIGGWRFYFNGYLQTENLARGKTFIAEAREAYADFSRGPFDLRIGRQIIVWGRADKVNPTDNLSVKHFQRLMTDDEDQRTGVGSLLATFNFGNTRLSGVWLPEWRETEFPLAKTEVANFSFPRPRRSFLQFAAKVDHAGDNTDWSLSYYHGHPKTPYLQIREISASGLSLRFDYDRVHVIGADVARNIEDIGVRAEAAYTHSTSDSELAPRSQLFLVAGADRSFWEHFNLNLQYLLRRVFDFNHYSRFSDPLSLSLIKQSQTASNHVAEYQSGLTARANLKLLQETLEIEMAYAIWFSKRDQIYRPKATYALDDHWKIIAGGEIYRGPRDSFFGRLRDTSSGFAELRLNF